MASHSHQTVLVLAPHPDDESLGCGGTIKLLTQTGAQVDVVYLTRGELGVEAPEAATPETKQRLAQVRSQEAHDACRILGVSQVTFLDGTDGSLDQQPHIADALQHYLRGQRYSRVFCPWPQEKHPDHVAAYQLLTEAVRRLNLSLHVWLYEVWTPLPPTICVPIDATLDAKLAAIRAHASQLRCIDYLSAFRGLAAYRSLLCPTAQYAEAFIAGDSQVLLGRTDPRGLPR